MEPSGSPCSSKSHWGAQIQSVESALTKLLKIEELLQGNSNLSSLKSFKAELESLSSFYDFLTKTKTIILSPDLGYFCVLPPEIIWQIVSYLDHVQLCRIIMVCKYFKELGDDDSIWCNLCDKLQLNTKAELAYMPSNKTWRWLCQSKLRVFKEGEKKEGVGMYIWPCKVNGLQGQNKHVNKYCGEWKDNFREGFGTYYWCNGSLYAGEWKQDKREGSGTRTWPNGNKYVGEYKTHKRHGTGEFTFSNGSIFKGTFDENRFIKGTYTWPNGRIYDGDWNNIFRHGHGKYWWPDGRTYIGDWKNDKRHGKGTYSWPDGDKFEGAFHEGKRWGKGVFTRGSTGERINQSWREEKFEEFNKGVPGLENEGEKNNNNSNSEKEEQEAKEKKSNNNTGRKRSHNSSFEDGSDEDDESEGNKLPKLNDDNDN